ncbi:MAG TPA: cupin domain-containing protein [Polyangiaceae bacterium]|nr:cupin domain-containing protein [Polyangiaceae bacterium]
MSPADHPHLEAIDYWIARLGLQPHPEGGWYAETYRSSGRHTGEQENFPASRSFATAIYFLLSAGAFSALHRIRSDEVWHFYAGMPLEIVVIDREGDLEVRTLGLNLERGEAPQRVVSAGAWFGASVAAASGYTLVGCTVAPGFDFRDFELARRDELTLLYPRHRSAIARYTRG